MTVHLSTEWHRTKWMPADKIQKAIQPEGSQTFGTMNHVQPPRHRRPRWSENHASCQVAYGLLGSENLTKDCYFCPLHSGTANLCESFDLERLVEWNQLECEVLLGFLNCFVCFVMLIQSQLMTLKLCDMFLWEATHKLPSWSWRSLNRQLRLYDDTQAVATISSASEDICHHIW